MITAEAIVDDATDDAIREVIWSFSRQTPPIVIDVDVAWDAALEATWATTRDATDAAADAAERPPRK